MWHEYQTECHGMSRKYQIWWLIRVCLFFSLHNPDQQMNAVGGIYSHDPNNLALSFSSATLRNWGSLWHASISTMSCVIIELGTICKDGGAHGMASFYPVKMDHLPFSAGSRWRENVKMRSKKGGASDPDDDNKWDRSLEQIEKMLPSRARATPPICHLTSLMLQSSALHYNHQKTRLL